MRANAICWAVVHFSAAGLLPSLFASQAFASFDLSPIIATVTPSGQGATTSFTITNTDDTKTPVQIGLFKREPTAEGVESYVESKDIGEMFQIFPVQMILNPKEKRTVRVTYVGDPKIAREMAFRVIAEEFPVNVSDPKRAKDRAVASISIASKYVGSLYVTPTGAIPQLSIEAAPSAGGGEKQMLLTMENKGAKHFLLKGAKFKVVSVASNTETTFPGSAFPGVNGQNILAGKTRKFVVPWPKDVPVGPVKVTVEVAQQ